MKLQLVQNNPLTGHVSEPLTMTSREIADLVKSRHDAVKTCISRLAERGTIDIPSVAGYLDAMGRSGQTEYLVDKRSSYIIVAQLSPEFTAQLVDRWSELENTVSKPLSTAQAFMQQATIMLAFENRFDVIEQSQATLSHHVNVQHNKIAERLDAIEDSETWKVCPAAAESIVRIRKRMNEKHGIASIVVDEVLRQSVYAPKPAGMVLNSSEFACGSHYAVYWKKDVSKVFELFMTEIERVTPTLFVHPFITGRFKASV